MTIPFPDLNPYETLQVPQSATEQDIKKSYRKLCLLHHPDKLINKTDNEIAQSKLQFEKIQFAHMILSNVDKRTRYDKTGSLEEIDSDASFDWFEYFTNIKAEITQESIMKDKSEYQGSSDEEEDIIEMWLENDGDFLNLFETIPHTEITWGDESRLFNKVLMLINDGVIESTKNWEIYQKNRKNLFKNLLKSLKDESKEAEELQKELLKDKKIDTEDDLKQLIQKRNAGRIDDLISNLEAKYGAKNSKVKKPKKNTKKHGITGSKRKEYEINDDEFAKLQQKMMNRKK